MSRQLVTDVYHFRGAGIIPATVVSNGPWKKTITGAAPPTCGLVNGSAVLALEATSQVQNVCLSFGDQLSYDVDDLARVRFWVHAPVALGDDAKARFGLASARADDPDAIAASLFFGLNADSATLLVESDGSVAGNEVAATSTGTTLGTAIKLCEFDFVSGIHAQAPPSVSVGGKHQIIASVTNVDGAKRRVAESVRLNLSDYTAGLQLYAQIQKTAATDLGSLGIRRIEVDHYVL